MVVAPTPAFPDPNYVATKLIPDLEAVVLATENGNNPATIPIFSFAGGESTYSFGLYQFDVGKYPGCHPFLQQIGFTIGEIARLSLNGGLPAAELTALNAKLRAAYNNPANADAIWTLNNLQSSHVIQQLTACLASVAQVKPGIATQIRQSEELQLRLLDYANQFSLDTPGQMTNWLRGLPSAPLTGTMIRAFVMNTQQGQLHPQSQTTRENALAAAMTARGIPVT